MAQNSGNNDRRLIYFVGTNLGHALTNKIHDIVAKELGLNWHLQALDSSSLDGFVDCLHRADFGGAVITIPHKISVMSYLDRIDDIGSLLGACNNVYKSPDGLLVGTNTDWIGVHAVLLQLTTQFRANMSEVAGDNKPGFVVGAGGAARAAVYALYSMLKATKIYIINRNDDEVRALVQDITGGFQRASLPPPVLIHLKEPKEASLVGSVFYGVGTVPDFEPATPAEIKARDVLAALLENGRGVFLDMCYKPRVTRNLRLAQEKGWVVGDGAQVVGWQLKAQWELWAGKAASEAIPLHRMIETVHELGKLLP
ncbi:hypothetical protein N0V95_008974 [Ascochyta clinopodiicola]|nr:hypothetical protein N0V95_008974 [Ascochyta clinopodiicola]